MRLTAPWVRERAQNDQDIETCGFFEGLDGAGPDGRLDPGGRQGGLSGPGSGQGKWRWQGPWDVAAQPARRCAGSAQATRRRRGRPGRRCWDRWAVRSRGGPGGAWRHVRCEVMLSAPPRHRCCRVPARRRVHTARPAGGGPQAPVVPLLPGPPHDCLRQRGGVQLPGKTHPRDGQLALGSAIVRQPRAFACRPASRCRPRASPTSSLPGCST